jgi:hypothetical protein
MARLTTGNIKLSNEALHTHDVPFFWKAHEWTHRDGRGDVIDDPDRRNVGVVVLYDRRSLEPARFTGNNFNSDQQVTTRTTNLITEYRRAHGL